MPSDGHISVLRVGENLIATLPPHPSDSTIDELQDRVLSNIHRTNSDDVDGVILDVEPVQTVDSFIARTIVETAKMVELMGVHPVLVGISPAIAVTATELGFSIGDVDTARDTDAAIDMLSDDAQ